MDTAIRLVATAALPFVSFWLGRLHQRRATDEPGVSRSRLAAAWVLAVGLAVTAVTAGVIEDQRLRADRQRAEEKVADLRRVSVQQIAKADGLAKALPPHCPRRVDIKLWGSKVEKWRTETARLMDERVPGLGQAFAADKGDYRHRCRIEWVRNRLGYFADKLTAISLATAGR